MVKLLVELECCISFTDNTKKEVLCNNAGQTALYWIVTKMPEMVNLSKLFLNKIFKLIGKYRQKML